jgi:GNAT superfamily N-acetyltransferase
VVHETRSSHNDRVRIDVRPATPARWDDLVELFVRPGPRGGKPFTDGCWCQFWHLRGKAYDAGWGESNRQRLERQVRSRRAPGLLAFLDGEPIGWCRLGPREEFERLEASRALARVDDEEVWSVVCFSVYPDAKRRGIASALLHAACAHAAGAGARILEGYAARPEHPNIDSYTGYLPMFLAAGFERVADGGRRTIVRRRVDRDNVSAGRPGSTR